MQIRQENPDKVLVTNVLYDWFSRAHMSLDYDYRNQSTFKNNLLAVKRAFRARDLLQKGAYGELRDLLKETDSYDLRPIRNDLRALHGALNRLIEK